MDVILNNCVELKQGLLGLLEYNHEITRRQEHYRVLFTVSKSDDDEDERKR